MDGRALTLLCSDLAKVIYNSVEIIFGNAINTTKQGYEKVNVIFQSGLTRPFDPFEGTDGLHSNVWNWVLGTEKQF